MIKRLPQRSSKKYLRIEKYKDYEFTHCIAYEMAIRNKEVITLTSLLENLNVIYYEIYKNMFSSTPDNLINLNTLLNSINTNRCFDSFNILLSQCNDHNYLLNILNKYNSDNINPIKSFYNEEKLKELFTKASDEDKIKIIFILLNSIELKLEKEYYVVNEKKSIQPKGLEEIMPIDTNYEPNYEINRHIETSLSNEPNYLENYTNTNGYTHYQGGYKNDNSFCINEVVPNFSQPLRMFNTMKISINPSLPLNDILSFVKKIKEDYDKNETFKSFFELLEEDFSSSENTTITTKIKYDKSKWADLFYIYDYFKFKKTQNETIYNIADELSIQLTFYYNKLHNKNNPNNLKPIPKKLTDGKLDFKKFIYTKEQDFNNELYLSADQIRKFIYKKISNLIDGENPEYKKLIDGKNHSKNSFIDGKNSDSSKL